MLFFKKKIVQESYDKTKTPVIRASICTGEQVAGFMDPVTGAFEEVMLIRTPAELETFKQRYGIEGEIKKVY